MNLLNNNPYKIISKTVDLPIEKFGKYAGQKERFFVVDNETDEILDDALGYGYDSKVSARFEYTNKVANKNSKHLIVFNKIKDFLKNSTDPRYFVKCVDSNGTYSENTFIVAFIPEYELVNQYIEFSNQLSKTVGHNIGFFLNTTGKTNATEKSYQDIMFLVSLHDNYLRIKVYDPYKGVSYDTDDLYPTCYNNKGTVVIFHPNGDSVVTGYKGKYFPANVKSIMKLPSDIAEIIFSEYAETSKLYKDFIRDSFKSTLLLSDLDKYHTKQEYFNSIFKKVTFLKNSNKLNCNILFYIGCAAEYIKEEQIPLLFQSAYIPESTDYMSDRLPYYETPSKRKAKEYAVLYLEEIFLYRYNRNPDDFLIHDYITMSIRHKNKINIRLSESQMWTAHDKFVKSLRYKNYIACGNKLKIKKGPLSKLEMPQEYKLLTTREELWQEGVAQGNCVANYDDTVEDGKSSIYSVTINEERLTVEIKYNKKNGYYVKQCLCRYNKDCKPETLKIVKDTLKDCAALIKN